MKPRLIIALLAVSLLAGCAQTAKNKALAAVSTVNSDAVTLAADSAKAQPYVVALTGSSSDESDAFSYASTIATDAQTLAPLIAGLINLIPTSAANHRGYEFTAKGIATLRHYGIRRDDPRALAKLMRADGMALAEN